LGCCSAGRDNGGYGYEKWLSRDDAFPDEVFGNEADKMEGDKFLARICQNRKKLSRISNEISSGRCFADDEFVVLFFFTIGQEITS